MRQPWGSSCLSSETSLCLRDGRAHSQVPSRRGSLQNGTFRMGELLANRGLGKEMPYGGKRGTDRTTRGTGGVWKAS